METAATKIEHFRVRGMHCANCAATIEKALSGTHGVIAARVNFAAETLTAEVSPELADGEIEARVKAAGYDATAEVEGVGAGESALDHLEARRNLLWVTFSAAGAAAVWYLQASAGEVAWTLTFLVASLIVLTAGLTFYRGAYLAARNRTANMDTLVALGISAAYIYSVLTTFPAEFFSGPRFFDTATALVFFIRFGKYLEARARGRAMAALRALLSLVPDSATVLRDGKELEIPAAEVRVGDVVVVRPASRIPVDGTIVEGASAIDESMLSGESMPVEKQRGDEVSGGTLNTLAALKVKATRVGSETVVAQVVRMVEEAQGDKAPIQRVADYVAARFVPAVIAIAVVTFAVWLYFGPGGVMALTAMTAVLVIACPCAMGLATPTALMVGSGQGLRAGILFKRSSALELITRVRVMMFDKTGTLTRGRPELDRAIALEGDDDGALSMAATVAAASVHPLSVAVVSAARERGLEIAASSGGQEIPGMGVTCQYQGRRLALGNSRLLEHLEIALSDRARDEAAKLAASRATALYLAVGDRLVAVLGFRDPLKPEAAGTVQALHSMGIRTVMLSGDNSTVAGAIASRVGIDEVHAELMPADKIELVRRFQKSGSFTAMVGDGINDAPALAAADIGIAIGSGTDVAKETGDVVLTRDDLGDIVRALELGRLTLRKVRQNLFWAFFYNTLGIPIAAGALYPAFGILLNPAWAGLAMAMSSVSVVTNALILGLTAPRKLRAVAAQVPRRSRTSADRINPPQLREAPSTAAAMADETAHGDGKVIEDRRPDDKEVKVMESKLKCVSCDYEIETPRHCNRAMHTERIDGADKLVCWMGAGCGVKEMPVHCGDPMREVQTA